MQTRFIKLIPLVVSAAVGVSGPLIQAQTYTNNAVREEHWRQDLDFLGTNLPEKHKDFYKLVPKETFQSEIAQIKNSVAQLSDTEIVIRLLRLVAAAGVSHTRLALPTSGALAFQRYPLWLRWYSDGCYVIAAAPEYRRALGKRVVRIGKMTPEQLLTNLAPYIAHENETWLREQSPEYMMSAELLQHLQAASNGSLELAFADAGTNVWSLSVSPSDWSASTNANGRVTVTEALELPTRLSRRNPTAFYWREYLPDSQTLFLQYNVCEDDPKQSFQEFVKETFAFIGAHSVGRLVIDVRYNGGGNSDVVRPLLEAVSSNPAINATGHLFVLIGPSTFSSGEWVAEQFHNSFADDAKRFHFQAILIGEPTGGKPNGYGDVRVLELPNSKLQVRYSTKHFKITTGDDPPSRLPDIATPTSWQNVLAGRDPALEAAIAYR